MNNELLVRSRNVLNAWTEPQYNEGEFRETMIHLAFVTMNMELRGGVEGKQQELLTKARCVIDAWTDHHYTKGEFRDAMIRLAIAVRYGAATERIIDGIPF